MPQSVGSYFWVGGLQHHLLGRPERRAGRDPLDTASSLHSSQHPSGPGNASLSGDCRLRHGRDRSLRADTWRRLEALRSRIRARLTVGRWRTRSPSCDSRTSVATPQSTGSAAYSKRSASTTNKRDTLVPRCPQHESRSVVVTINRLVQILNLPRRRRESYNRSGPSR